MKIPPGALRVVCDACYRKHGVFKNSYAGYFISDLEVGGNAVQEIKQIFNYMWDIKW